MTKKKSFGQAVTSVFKYLFGSRLKEYEESLEDEEKEEEHACPYCHPENKHICPRCHTEMEIIHPSSSDIFTVNIYRCPECGVIKEAHYDENNELHKESYVYNELTKHSNYMELIAMVHYNGFQLDRLWEVCGVLCYPILMKTEFADSVELFFIPVDDNLSMNAISGFLVTPNDTVTRVQIGKTNDMSYFTNPYLYRLPHSTFLYATVPFLRNQNIAYVEPIRYRHKITDRPKGSGTIQELYIIEDFALPCYGLEVYVKFFTMSDEEYSIRQLLDLLDIRNIILGSDEVNASDQFYLCNTRLSKLNLYAMGNKSVTEEQRIKFADAIYAFFDRAIDTSSG